MKAKAGPMPIARMSMCRPVPPQPEKVHPKVALSEFAR